MTEIIDKRPKKWTCEVRELEIGDVFEFNNKIYMVVKTMDYPNVFNLTDRKLTYIAYDLPVFPLDVEICIH